MHSFVYCILHFSCKWCSRYFTKATLQKAIILPSFKSPNLLHCKIKLCHTDNKERDTCISFVTLSVVLSPKSFAVSTMDASSLRFHAKLVRVLDCRFKVFNMRAHNSLRLMACCKENGVENSHSSLHTSLNKNNLYCSCVLIPSDSSFL